MKSVEGHFQDTQRSPKKQPVASIPLPESLFGGRRIARSRLAHVVVVLDVVVDVPVLVELVVVELVVVVLPRARRACCILYNIT